MQSDDFSYVSHTADVGITARGPSVNVAFARCGLGLFNYMCTIDQIEGSEVREFTARGRDMEQLLYKFMGELLFLYGSEFFIGNHINIVQTAEFELKVQVHGEIFRPGVHSGGVEIKAITMHGLSIEYLGEDMVEVMCLVDI